VLVDVHMPNGGGKTIIESVLRTNPDVRFPRIVGVGCREDVIAIIRAGARGYVTKSMVRRAGRRRTPWHEGDAVFGPGLAGFVLDAFAGDPVVADADTMSADPELDKLTAREGEVLRLIARGYTYKEIGSPPRESGQDGRDPCECGPAQLQLSTPTSSPGGASDRGASDALT